MILDDEKQRAPLIQCIDAAVRGCVVDASAQSEEQFRILRWLRQSVDTATVVAALPCAGATAPSGGDALMPQRVGAPHGDGQLQEQVAPSVGNGQRQVS